MAANPRRTAIRRYRFRDDPAWPSLGRIGVAVQSFPAWRQPDEQAPRPSHDILYASLLVAGRLEHIVGDERWTEAPGTLTVVGQGVPHLLVTGPEPVQVVNLYLDPERHALPQPVGELQELLLRFLPLHRCLVHERNRIRRLRFVHLAEPLAALAGLEREQTARGPGWEQAMLAHLQLFLLACARCLQASGEQAGGPQPEDMAMERLRLQLDRRFAERWELPTLAAAQGLSQASLCRRFRRHTGTSILAYLQQRRLEAALIALRSTRRPVLDIALEVGFGDVTWFNRVFRRCLGVTPGIWRRQSEVSAVPRS